MTIDTKTRIGGIPILEVRRFLRESINWNSGWSERSVKETLSLNTRQTRALISHLFADKYIDRAPSNENQWRNTVAGNALACASAALPLHRQAAEKKLDEFLTRVDHVNSPACEFIYSVEEVVLFGSMLTHKARVSDVDVSIRLGRKYTGESFNKAHDLRMKVAKLSGRSFPTFMAQIFWPEQEVYHFLKHRFRSLSMAEWNEEWMKTQPHKVIYCRPASHAHATDGAKSTAGEKQ